MKTNEFVNRDTRGLDISDRNQAAFVQSSGIVPTINVVHRDMKIIGRKNILIGAAFFLRIFRIPRKLQNAVQNIEILDKYIFPCL